MNERAAVAMSLALALLCSADPAWSFCRKTTCDSRRENCAPVNGCDTRGLPVYWPTSCVMFSVDAEGSPRHGIDYETAVDVLTRSFLTWGSVRCGGRPASLEFKISRVPLSCGHREFSTTGPNANSWLFHDEEWPYAERETTLALTTLSLDLETGAILDADVEVNSLNIRLSAGDTDVRIDLESVATHEIGHFIGLDHSQVGESTMWVRYGGGHTRLRDLAPDDVAGMCTIYPPGRSSIQNADCAPTNGFSSECAPSTAEGKACGVNCAVARATPGRTLLGFGVGLGLLAVVRWRRRKSAKSAK